MGALKTVGSFVLGVVVFVALVFFAFVVINGTASIGEKVLPFLIRATTIVTGFCIVVLFPLAFFRATRTVSAFGLYLASYVFGLAVWMYGFLVTFYLWGAMGVFIGLGLGGVGVVPLGFIAAVTHGMWGTAGELFYGLALTFGARAFALYLARKIDASEEAARIVAEGDFGNIPSGSMDFDEVPDDDPRT